MATPSLLSVGYYPELLQLRSHLLRQKGYAVLEAGDLQTAISLAKDGKSCIRLLLFCHTVPAGDQNEIMVELLQHRSVPTLSICRLEHANGLPGKPVSVSPETLLSEVQSALDLQSSLKDQDA